jgi:hypothetical protein
MSNYQNHIEDDMAKKNGQLKLSDLRFPRVNYGEYFRPTVPNKLLEKIGWTQEGELYQWDFEMVNGQEKITLIKSPRSEPSVLSILRQGEVEQ